jgi:epidermal growth factor receptor substrate 15
MRSILVREKWGFQEHGKKTTKTETVGEQTHPDDTRERRASKHASKQANKPQSDPHKHKTQTQTQESTQASKQANHKATHKHKTQTQTQESKQITKQASKQNKNKTGNTQTTLKTHPNDARERRGRHLE